MSNAQSLFNQLVMVKESLNTLSENILNSIRSRIDAVEVPNFPIGVGSNGSFSGFASGRTFNGTPGNDTFNIIGDRNTINGGGGNNSFDIVGNSNRITGGPNRDRFNVVGNNSVLNGGGGNDRLLVAGNSNTLGGGDGADTLIVAGQGNRLNAGAGNDTLLAGGNNTLNGGTGNDRFLLAPFEVGPGGNPQTPGQSLIQDFKDNEDKIVLPTERFLESNGLQIRQRLIPYNELTISQQPQGVGISFQGRSFALLQGIQLSQITTTDFAAPTAAEAQLIRGFRST